MNTAQNLHFRKMGQGPDLIIVHGLFGSCDNWLSVARLLENHYTLWLIDQRNHGRSPHTHEWNYEAMATDLLGFMDTHQIGKANILGHSMGGKTVMHFALAHPERVQRLIIADISPKAYPNHHQTILKGLESIDLDTITDRKQADLQLSMYAGQGEIRQFLLKNLYRNEQENFEWRINLPVITQNIEQVGRPQSIPTGGTAFVQPTLFLRGDDSGYINLPEDEAHIHSIFPNATIQTIEDAGHWLHAEKPQEFVEKVMAFLGDKN